METGDGALALGVAACALCVVHEVEWVHHLDWDRAQFRVYGKGHVWGSPIHICESCHALLIEKDVEALVAVRVKANELSPTDLDEQIRNGNRALVTADLGGRPIDETRPSGYRKLIEQGFAPLEQVTGDLTLADVWPKEHRRGLAEPDAELAADLELPEGQHWFVRSPWATVPLSRLFELISREADRALREGHADEGARRIGPADWARKQAAVEAIFASDESLIRRRLGL